MKQERGHQREPRRDSLAKELDSVLRTNSGSCDFNNSTACIVAPMAPAETSSKSARFNKLQEGDRMQLSRRVRAASIVRRPKSVEWNTTEEEAKILPTFKRGESMPLRVDGDKRSTENNPEKSVKWNTTEEEETFMLPTFRRGASMPLPVDDDKRRTENTIGRRRSDSMNGENLRRSTKTKPRQTGGETLEVKKSYRERPERRSSRRRSPDKQRRTSSRSGCPEEFGVASDAAINFVDEETKPARRLESTCRPSNPLMDASDAALLFVDDDPKMRHKPISPQKALEQLLDGSPDAAVYFLEEAMRSERRAESPRRSSNSPRKISTRGSLRRLSSNGGDQDAEPSVPRSKPHTRNSSRSSRKVPRSASDQQAAASI